MLHGNLIDCDKLYYISESVIHDFHFKISHLLNKISPPSSRCFSKKECSEDIFKKETSNTFLNERLSRLNSLNCYVMYIYKILLK